MVMLFPDDVLMVRLRGEIFFTPQDLQFPVLDLSSIHAEATCMVEKACLCRSVDTDWRNDVWRPKYIF